MIKNLIIILKIRQKNQLMICQKRQRPSTSRKSKCLVAEFSGTLSNPIPPLLTLAFVLGIFLSLREMLDEMGDGSGGGELA